LPLPISLLGLRLALAKRSRVARSKPFPPEAGLSSDPEGPPDLRAYGMLESSGNMLNGKYLLNALKKIYANRIEGAAEDSKAIFKVL